MTHDIHALSGAYAVDAVDEHERAEFEQHLAECTTCQAEVASLREAAAVMGAVESVAPPAELRGRVLAQIKEVRPLPPLAAVDSQGSGTSSVATGPASSQAEPTAKVISLAGRTRARRWLASAAAVAAIAVGATVVWQAPWQNAQQGQTQVALADQIRTASDAEHVKLMFDGGGEATVYRSKSLGKAVIVTENMPAAPSGKVYQAWLQDAEGKMASAGVMPSGANQSVVLAGDAAAAAGAGITVEPDGGSDQPTSTPIGLFAFPA